MNANIAEQIAELFNVYVGGNWTIADVQAMMDDEDCCVIYHTMQPAGCVNQQSLVIAAATARILRDEECGWYKMPIGSGFMESAAVVQEYQRKGIGKQMLKARLSWCRIKGIKTVCALAWESGQPNTSRPLLETMGFKFADLFENEWAGQSCPVCGTNCRCNAALMKFSF